MTSVFTIKLTHLTTGALKLIPLDDEQFRLLITSEEDDRIKDRVFADIIYRHDEERDWLDHYEFNGIFLGTVRKDRT